MLLLKPPKFLLLLNNTRNMFMILFSRQWHKFSVRNTILIYKIRKIHLYVYFQPISKPQNAILPASELFFMLLLVVNCTI